ncbi:MAG: hypothetical protein M5U13_03140 [Thermoanaerobaculia bacterium]|nr:hypothetical protein [Thermoanaerobaculia bacterium]
MSWTVEEALKEVVAEIVNGAGKLAVSQAIRDDLAARYRPDFEREYREGSDWEADQKKVLPLAYLVGSLAATLTVADHVLRESRVPTEVDRKQALAAAYIVSRGPCSAGEITIQGKYCRDFPIDGGSADPSRRARAAEMAAKGLAIGLVQYLWAGRE